MTAPLGSPENPVTAFVGRHPRVCGAGLAAAGAAILHWQVVRPLVLLDAEAEGEVTLSPVLGAMGLLIAATGVFYLWAGPRAYAWLVTEKTPERARRMRLAGVALGAGTFGFYLWLVSALEAAGWTRAGG